MSVKDDCLAVATKLAEAEAAGETPELTALHETLRGAMYRNAELLGLSGDDLAEIDAVGPAMRGGTPKTKPTDG